jgi:hypothetical protein
VDSLILSIVNLATLIFVIVYSLVLIWRAEKDAPSVGDLLYDLLTNHTAIISISKIDETSVCVSIVADWTEYAEQCFFNETLEGALSMAIEHKAKAENRKAGE